MVCVVGGTLDDEDDNAPTNGSSVPVWPVPAAQACEPWQTDT